MKTSLVSHRLALAAGVLVATLLVSAGAQAATCAAVPGANDDYISIPAVGSFTSCTTSNGSDPQTQNVGYVLIQDNTYANTTTTSGSFSVPSGYSSLQLLFESDTGLPHPDQFNIVFAYISSFSWTLVNPGSDFVEYARLYGLPTVNNGGGEVPLPPAIALFGSGLAGLGLIGAARRKRARRAA